MKLFRVFNVVVLCMALTMLSCSGEDGADGENGLPGTDGNPGPAGAAGAAGADGISCWDLNGNGVGDITIDADNEDTNLDGVVDTLDCEGTDGTDGTDGVDGNANVQRVDVLITDAAGVSVQVPVAELTQDVLDNSAIFLYVTNNGLIYPIPGAGPNHDFDIRTYIAVGQVNLIFSDPDTNAGYAISPGDLDELIVVIAEVGIGLGNKGAQESVMAKLKKAGVDTNDYQAMADYFGLE